MTYGEYIQKLKDFFYNLIYRPQENPKGFKEDFSDRIRYHQNFEADTSADAQIELRHRTEYAANKAHSQIAHLSGLNQEDIDGLAPIISQ